MVLLSGPNVFQLGVRDAATAVGTWGVPGQSQWREKENKPVSFRNRLCTGATCRPYVRVLCLSAGICAQPMCLHWADLSSRALGVSCRCCMRISAPGLGGCLWGYSWVHSEYSCECLLLFVAVVDGWEGPICLVGRTEKSLQRILIISQFNLHSGFNFWVCFAWLFFINL